jgi:hypothetical protein
VDSAWEAIFMLLVLKIPLVYLAVVVWWAIRAEPVIEDGSDGDKAPLPLTPCGWDDWKRGRRVNPRARRPLQPGGRPSLARVHRSRAATSA